MRYSSQVKPISYLKANAAEVLTRLAKEREPMVITQNGEAKAVLQDVASFEETQETLALLKILALGNRTWLLARSSLQLMSSPVCAPSEPPPDGWRTSRVRSPAHRGRGAGLGVHPRLHLRIRLRGQRP